MAMRLRALLGDHPCTAALKNGSIKSDLVELEFEARKAKGQLKESIAEESRALADWLRLQHPRHPKLEPKSIRNKLGSKMRAAIAQK